MKIIYRILVVMLVMALAGIAVTAIVKTNKSLDRGRAAIASADDFLARYENYRGR